MHPRRLLAATLGATLLVAAPAAAHPAFNPNTVPLGELYTLQLVVPHGCTSGGGSDAGEEASPTVALSVKVPEGVEQITPYELDGWTLGTTATTFTWADDGGATTAPITFRMDLQLRADATGPVYFTVAQDCAEGSVLWQARPGEDGQPAAVLNPDGEGGHHGDAGADHGEGESTGEGEGHGAQGSEGAEGDHGAAGPAEGDGPAGDATHAAAEAGGKDAKGYDVGLLVLVILMLVGGFTAILRSGGSSSDD